MDSLLATVTLPREYWPLSETILLVQNDSHDAGAVTAALLTMDRAQLRLECVVDGAAGIARLRAGAQASAPHGDRIVALLLDLVLPDSTGMASFDKFFAAAPQVPILVLCEPQHEHIARLAVQRGAQDYLLKDRADARALPKALVTMLERGAIAEAMFQAKEHAELTLNSIGDAVISTDAHGMVNFLNIVAENLTGWTSAEALGQPLGNVFHIFNASSGELAPDPMALAIRNDRTMGLTPNCVLVRRDRSRIAIEDSAAPIHNRQGQVTGAVMVFRDVSAARALSTRMSYQAQHDSLTNLPNRTLLLDRMGQAVALAQRHQLRLAVLYLDLDGFKHVNDSLGHATGDRLLQAVALRLLGAIRSSDTVCRLGGDEFVVLLSELAQDSDAATSAEKLRRVLIAPFKLAGKSLTVTASMGIAMYPDDGADADVLLRHADAAMYHAKESGRDNCQYFNPEMRLHMAEAFAADARSRVRQEHSAAHEAARQNTG